MSEGEADAVEAGATPGAPAGASRRSRLGAATLVIAALATGVAIGSQAPDTDARERPFVRAGSLGQSVSGRTFDVAVVAVRGAARIERSGRTRDTGGVWVLARVRAVARDRPTTIDYAAVRDARDRTTLATPRVSQPLAGGGYTLQPGIPVEGEIAFEVPRDSATGLTVRLADPSDTRMDAVVEVPIAVDRATVDRWLAQPSAAVLDDAVVAP